MPLEALFYHLERSSLEDTLPGLVEKTLARGWRALIRAGSEERAAALDAHLWSFREESFLPHGRTGEPFAERQPVLIALDSQNRNTAQVLFLVDGAAPGDWAMLEGSYQRAVFMFDGRDEAALACARAEWMAAKAAGCEATYWQQTPQGKWEKRV